MLAEWARWVQDHPYQTVFYGFGLFFLFVVNDLWHRVARWGLKRKIRNIENPQPTHSRPPVSTLTQPTYTIQNLQNMDWQAFERLTANLFQQHGYTVQMTKMGGDGGVDIFATQGNSRVVVSCKNYSGIVGPDKVRELHSVTITNGAQVGFLVTSGHFSPQTKSDATYMTPRIHLIDGQHLANLLNRVPGISLYP